MKWLSEVRERRSDPAGLRQPDDGSEFESICKNAALLVEAERVAQLGSWEHDLLTGQETWSANLSEILGFGRFVHRVSENLFWNLVHPDDREMVRTIIDCALKDHLPSYEYQARFILATERERVLVTRGRLEFDASGRLVRRMGVAQDVTIAVEQSRALHESERRYRDLVENSFDLICTHDFQGRLLSMNERPARILGYSPTEIIGRKIKDLLIPERRDEFDTYIREIVTNGTASGLVALRTRRGELRVWEYHNSVRTEGLQAPIVRGMAHDITERIRVEQLLRESQEELQKLSARLVQSQDDERRRVSLTLHEKIAQSLAGLRMMLSAVSEADPTLSPAGRTTINDCYDIASQALSEVKTLAYCLHPPLLEEGLSLAVSWHVSRFAATSGIQVSFEIPPDFGRLPESHEQALFRIVQECLTNANQHSGSEWAAVKLRRDDENVTLIVQDGGHRSCEKDRRLPVDAGQGFGMLLMRERIRELHGTFRFHNSDAGFVVRVSLPAAS